MANEELNLDDLINLARKLNNQKKYHEVIDLLSEEVLNKYQNVELTIQKIHALFSLDQKEEFTQLISTLSDDDLTNPMGFFYRGHYYETIGESGKAEKLLLKSLEYPKSSASIYKLLAFITLKAGKVDDSIKYAKEAIKLNPFDYRSHNILGEAYQRQEQYEEAINKFNQVIANLPNDAHTLSNLAFCHHKLNHNEEAIKLFDQILVLTPNDAVAYFNKGNTFLNMNQLENAKFCFEKAIEINPTFSDALLNLGLTIGNLGEYESSIEIFKRLIELDPARIEGYLGLGKSYNRLGWFNESKSEIEKALEINPDNIEALIELGIIYRNKKSPEMAFHYLKLVLQNEPTNLSALLNFGITFYEIDQQDNAISFFKSILKISKDNYSALLWLGIVNLKIGRLKTSNRYFSLCLKSQSPDRFTCHYFLGLTYFYLFKLDESLIEFENYLKHASPKNNFLIEYSKARINDIHNCKNIPFYKNIFLNVNKIKTILVFKENTIAHYSSFSSTIELIFNNSPFRLSEGNFLNDTSEGKVLKSFFGIDHVNRVKSDTDPSHFIQKPFIGSFVSEIKSDYLTLWRMYGKEKGEDAKGCVISFNCETFLQSLKIQLDKNQTNFDSNSKDDELFFYRVAYKDSIDGDKFTIPGNTQDDDRLNYLLNNLKKSLIKFNKIIEIKDSDKIAVNKLINAISFLFKSIEFQHEHELRLVLDGVGFEKLLNNGTNPPKVYIETLSLKKFITKITLGPKVERAEEWAAAFHYNFEKEDLKPEILISNLPFK